MDEEDLLLSEAVEVPESGAASGSDGDEGSIGSDGEGEGGGRKAGDGSRKGGIGHMPTARRAVAMGHPNLQAQRDEMRRTLAARTAFLSAQGNDFFAHFLDKRGGASDKAAAGAGGGEDSDDDGSGAGGGGGGGRGRTARGSAGAGGRGGRAGKRATSSRGRRGRDDDGDGLGDGDEGAPVVHRLTSQPSCITGQMHDYQVGWQWVSGGPWVRHG
jgi:hypothetical protein